MKLTFTHDPLTPLDDTTTPTPRAIRLLRDEVYANLCDISCTLGGGGHGYLGMVMPPDEYNAIAVNGTAFAAPAMPQVPGFQDAAAFVEDTAALVAGLQENYRRQLAVYEEHKEVSTQIKALMLKAIPNIYISALKHQRLGYANTTPRQILNHLLETYGAIEPRHLAENTKLLKAPWNPDTPIETVFDNGAFCRDFAAEGNDPISDATYTRILVEIFAQAGVLEKAVDDWNQKPINEQTLENATAHFKSYNKHRLTKLSTSTKEVLAANPATTQMEALLASAQDLVAKATANNNKKSGKLSLEGFGYCWTHGVCTHTSKTCKYKDEGHQVDATIKDMKGGKNGITLPKYVRDQRNRDRENTSPNNNN
jgi:hypothetical protein